MKKLICVVVLGLFLAGCTDAKREKLFSLGDSAHVVCYSGGMIIYDGYSTGKISSSEMSDGYFFRDKVTNKLKEVSGDCVITY